MKKFLLVLSTMLLLGSFPANAYKIGDVVNKTVYTDIIASINDYNITSFNIDGYTGVVAEDLANYGFIVNWNADERALYISRNTGYNRVDSLYIAPEIPKSQVGQKANDVLYSDIKTYINGNPVTSYNIGGKTVVYFEDLSSFGEIEYRNAIRRLDLDISDGLNYKISPPVKYLLFPAGLYFETNSADGLQIRWTAYNNTNKTINYYTTTYFMFNSVGDFARDRYGNNYFTCKTIGPVKNGEMLIDFTDKYKAEVYDTPCSEVYLYTIDLEYDDGSKETIYYDHIGFER